MSKKNDSFNWNSSVICKGCKTHHALDFLRSLAILNCQGDPVTFPEGNFSIIHVRCPNDGEIYEYKQNELYHPTDKEVPKGLEKRVGFNWDGEILCKECNYIHRFADYGNLEWRAYCFEFPKGNLASVNIPCLKNLKAKHEYAMNEILMPRNNLNSSEERITKIESRLAKLEERLSALDTKTAELPEKEGIKLLKDEIKEDFTSFLADALKQKGGERYVG